MLTAHRRENWGEPLKDIFRGIRRVVDETPDIKVIFPIHYNPLVREAAEILKGCDNIRIIEPLNVFDFNNYLMKCHLVLSDSGGIQEEAPAFGKPVLVLRNVTERPEGVEAGALKLVGNSEKSVYESFKLLVSNEEIYKKMSSVTNTYGDGNACRRIADILESSFKKDK